MRPHNIRGFIVATLALLFVAVVPGPTKSKYQIEREAEKCVQKYERDHVMTARTRAYLKKLCARTLPD